ncbi:hypothetical protein [Edaphobacter modestus]|jgi:hypothetical protein|nr:hypothetical protein [Edaphobacter modestus]RZU35506.1 hypothetical protein BDD14_5566 [Edaphobacter modestus]
MAFPTAVNDAKSKFNSTPISESEINEAFKALQSKDAGGNAITVDVLGAFVQYTALQFAGQKMFDVNKVDAMANQILSYLQSYDGNNKRIVIQLFGGGEFIADNVGAGQGVSVGYDIGALPGIGKNWAIVCFALWD